MITAIKPPFALLWKPVKVIPFYTIEPTEMPLCLIPEIPDSVYIAAFVCKLIRVIDTAMMKRTHIQCVIGFKCPLHLLISIIMLIILNFKDGI